MRHRDLLSKPALAQDAIDTLDQQLNLRSAVASQRRDVPVEGPPSCGREPPRRLRDARGVPDCSVAGESIQCYALRLRIGVRLVLHLAFGMSDCCDSEPERSASSLALRPRLRRSIWPRCSLAPGTPARVEPSDNPCLFHSRQRRGPHAPLRFSRARVPLRSLPATVAPAPCQTDEQKQHSRRARNHHTVSVPNRSG